MICAKRFIETSGTGDQLSETSAKPISSNKGGANPCKLQRNVTCLSKNSFNAQKQTDCPKVAV
jgi:hypothetical protein